MSSVKSRSESYTVAEFKAVCIEEATVYAISKDSMLLYEPSKAKIKAISSRSVQSIKDTMTLQEKNFTQAVIRMIERGATNSEISNFVKKSNLPFSRQLAANNFISTYLSSKKYWNENGEDWINYVDNNIVIDPSIKSSWYEDIRWGDVALSDAYYAWYGTVSSGMNIYVGAGAAGVGSIASVLNQL